MSKLMTLPLPVMAAHKAPGKLETLFKARKTCRLVKNLMADTRISTARKAAFCSAVIALAVVMLYPELIADTFISPILPFISLLIGVPMQAGIDWVAFIMLLPYLLKVFPSNILAEHYESTFRPPAKAKS